MHAHVGWGELPRRRPSASATTTIRPRKCAEHTLANPRRKCAQHTLEDLANAERRLVMPEYSILLGMNTAGSNCQIEPNPTRRRIHLFGVLQELWRRPRIAGLPPPR